VTEQYWLKAATQTHFPKFTLSIFVDGLSTNTTAQVWEGVIEAGLILTVTVKSRIGQDT
jgi:hypothetical protein